jgi:hypothetical protein
MTTYDLEPIKKLAPELKDAALNALPGFATLSPVERSHLWGEVHKNDPRESTTEREKKPRTAMEAALVERLSRLTPEALQRESALNRAIAADCGLQEAIDARAGKTEAPPHDYAGEIAALIAARDAADKAGDYVTGGLLQTRVYAAERAMREANGGDE